MSLLSDYRAKYPLYKDVSDDELATALHSKYYSDIPYDEFSSKVGITKADLQSGFKNTEAKDLITGLKNSDYPTLLKQDSDKLADQNTATTELKNSPIRKDFAESNRKQLEQGDIVANGKRQKGDSALSQLSRKQANDLMAEPIANDVVRQGKINDTEKLRSRIDLTYAEKDALASQIGSSDSAKDSTPIVNVLAESDFAKENPISASLISSIPTFASGIIKQGIAPINQLTTQTPIEKQLANGEGVYLEQNKDGSVSSNFKNFEQKLLIDPTNNKVNKYLDDVADYYTSNIAKETFKQALDEGHLGTWAAVTTAQQFPQLAMMVTSAITRNPAILNQSLNTMAASAGGNIYGELIKQGVPQNEAAAISIVHGQLEKYTEKMEFDLLGDVIGKQMTKAFAKQYYSALATGAAKSVAIGAVTEYGEEASGGIAGDVFAKSIADNAIKTNPNNKALINIADKSLDEILADANNQGLAGATSGGLLGGAFAYRGAKDELDNFKNNQSAIIEQKNSADYDAQQRQAASDLAVTKVTDEANTIDDAIQLAQTAIDTPLVTPSGLLGSATQSADIYSDDILGDSNVNDTANAAADVVTAAGDVTSDNVQGSVADLPIQSDGGGLDNTTKTPTQSIGSNQPIGNAGAGNDAVTAERPFATADNDFLPKMRSMTNDAKVISQIDAELALRGLTGPTTGPVADTTTVPVAEAPSPASWVVRNKETGEPIMETFQKSVADKANKEKYEVVPILQHLQELNEEGSKARNYAQRDTSAQSTEPAIVKATDPVKKAAKTKPAKAPKTKTLLAVLRDLGGVAMSEKLDITGEERGFAAGGYNQIFKKSSTRSLKGLIESGDLDEYLPYNMRLEANGMNDDAFDSTEAYDYLADKIRGGEGVLPYAVEEELRALQYESNAAEDAANELNEDEINEQLTQATNEERESTTNARVFNTDSENGSTGSGERNTGAAETDTNEQAQDLLGDNTAAKQALADAERTKDAKRNSGTDNPESFTLTGSTSEADQAAAAGAQSLFDAPTKTLADYTNDGKQAFLEGLPRTVPQGISAMYGAGWLKGWDRANIDAPIEADAAPAETQKYTDETRFANNKVFTADKVAAARARLKSKLNTLNSGIDPELLIDGMTIAGAYIETGVRKFSDYAKAMTDDFGDSIKPYLLSFYEAARAYPSIDKEGMTDAESAAKEHQALLTPAVLEQAKEVIGQGLVTTPKAKAKPNGQIKLTQDWGVDNIDGWTDNKDGTGTNERENGVTNGVKEQFLAEGKKYLTQVSKLLEAEGWQAHTDRRGRTQKPVSVNEAGPAVSGEVTLTMRKGDAGVYVDLGTSSIRGLTGNHPQGVSVMIRATGSADTDQFANKGQNIWLSADLSSTELANKLVQTAERYVKNTIQAEEGNQNARTTENQDLPNGSTQSNLLTEQPRSGNSEPMGSGLAAESDNTTGQGRVSSGVSETSGNGTQGTSRSNRNESPSGSRETSNAGNNTRAADDLNDFAITDETGIGEGSIAQKYNDNITAIKLIKTLESENRAATPEERNQLAKYNGFGALSKVFEKNNPKYQELKDLLTESEYESARASILNAYYTSPTIVSAMYDAVAHMGFKGGRILEPSLGSGNFFGMMPAAMRNKSKLNGVELDDITSRLAKYLYPNANISVATGFQEYKAPQGYFDLVISNPPFGSEQLRDSEKADYSGFSIHNFFIAKSIDKLRDDGILAVVVSHSFMDAMDSKAREWIGKRAVLRGAVRLPNTAFKDNAGTEVITDILFFQKTNMPEQNPDWVNASNNGDYSFNDYFYANPRSVLGRITDTTSQFGKTFTIEPISGNGTLKQQLKEFTNSLLADVYVEPENRIEVLDSADSTVPDGVKVGTFYTDDKGVIRQRLPDMLGAKRSSAWEVPNAKAQERMLGMMNLRDLLRNQMRLERDPMATEKEIEANRKQMNSKYDAYLKEFGYLNSMTNRRLFLDDTESALLQALELDYDQGVTAAKALTTGMDKKEPSAQKADIFTRRVLFPPSDSITVNNAKDALLASLNVKGVVDVDYMAEVYSKPKAEIISELGDVVYNDPNRGYVTADEYLSGDVKTKLTEAKSYAKEKPEFNRNVEALEKVIPKDKLPSEIYASAGANWIPADVYADFASEITGIPKDGVEFKYISAAATWLSEKTRGGDAGKMTSDYGTPEINSFDMFALLINGKAPEVREMIGYGSDRRSVVNIEKTEAARSKLEKVKETWNSWIFKDADRADRLATIYNDKHNRTVKREFNGSHMQFAGMTPAVSLRTHQKNVVWRAIQDRNVLLDHVVGAGKTMAAAAIAMEMKRLGIARKPLFVVPNHLTLQWRSEFTKLYPASNILAATPEDFAKDKREKLFSKMVTGNYDAIIIGHSSLTKIGLPADVEAKMYDEQVKEIAQAIEAAKTERGDRGITRDMEKIKQNLETKIKKLKDKAGAKDNVVSFDELGIDALVVDEMHEFKNLFFTTQMQRTAGLGNPSGSGKALDLFMKIKFMTDTYGENVPLITMTGTPVSNSLAEMFTMQRFMKYPSMKRQDLHLFDAWAKQFGEVENVYEVAPSGVGYRQSTRFSKFKNLPALMGSYTGFADIITMQDLKDQTAAQIDPQTGKAKVFPVPKLKTGKPINVIAQRSDLQRDFFGVPQLATNEQTGEIEFELDPENAIIEQNKEGKYQIIAQVKNDEGEVIGRQSAGNNFDTQEDAELELVTKSLTPKTFIDPESLLGKFANLATLTRESKGKINALSLTGLASKAGLDYRIIDPSAADFPDSKINQSVTNMVSLWKETAKDKGAQIVFCDMSIPNSARNDMSSKERRIYVRDREGELTHKAKGVVYAPEGYEGFPFYITKGRNGFDVYEAVSGTMVRDYGIADKAEAKAWITNFVESESNRDRVFVMRDTKTIDQSDIEEYRDAKELEVADDGSNEISTADLEAVAGSSKFSVYDDIKTKLISAGVPENQIAFIHDYNTPKQKEELFKRVNAGDVRFLFGSTPKLGAGTNVQKRLVGLHHIDAPWRPSDLEQREGRIIRQGNELYARDPENFEISIWRYATEQTYDTRRWQLLEHKAAGIEQLRKYSGESEIEDVASEASNSADMKAAASGNPLILEETKLSNEVKRLINLEKAHADSRYAMARKVRDNTSYINEYLPKQIAMYKEMIATVKANPIPEDKTKVAAIKIDGKATTSREVAEKAIADLALKVRSLNTLGEADRVIQYRGIEFTVNRGSMINSLTLRAPTGSMHVYSDKEGVSPSGLITRFNNYIDSFDARIEDAKNSIEKTKVESASLSQRLDEAFEYSDKLKQTQAQHANVKRRLMKSNQLESVPDEQRPEFDRLVKERKESLKELGFDKALSEAERDSNDTPVFSLGNGSRKGMPKQLVQSVVNTLRKNWKNAPEIIVVESMDDPAIRKAVRDEDARLTLQGSKHKPIAFYDSGKVYILSTQVSSAKDVQIALFHEALGHHGLRHVFGKDLAVILDSLVLMRTQDVIAKAKQYGLKPSVRSDLKIAAEEVLAEMAQTNPQIKFVQRAVAAIRKFLRSIGVKMELTDNDIIYNFILPARNFVVKGGKPESFSGLIPAMLLNNKQTETEAFKNWFGDSKVVDAEGNPLVVYHGTNEDIKAFDENKGVKVDAGWLARGFYFTTNPDTARYYATNAKVAGQAAPNTMPVYLSIKNPYYATLADKEEGALKTFGNKPEFSIKKREELISKGYDGVILDYSKGGFSNELEIVVFKPEQVKSAVGNNGDFDPANPDIRFSRTEYAGGNLTPEAETRIEALQRAVQDQFAIFKRTQEKLLANGGVVGDRENVYEAMMRYPARFRNKVTDFMRGTFNPIVDRIGKIDTDFNELGRYMLALHAKEGNAYIQTINEDKDAGVGMTNAEAAKVIQEAKVRPDFAEFDSIARDLQNITNMRLNMLVTAGVYSQEQADAMRKQYQFYVPVKGFADLEVDDLPAQFTGSGFSTTKKLDMRRKGRKSEPSQIVENIIRDYQVAVAAVEKANVGRYLRNLVAVNPNSSLWTLEEAPTQKVIEQDKRIWAVMDGENEIDRFTTKREASTTAALLNKGSSNNAQVVQVAPKETVVNRPIAYDREQEVRFIEGGKEYRIQLKDPLMANSYNGLNKVITYNMFIRGVDKTLGFFREMWTQKNPAFILINAFLRDPQSALAVGIPLRGLSWTKKMYGNYLSASKALYQFESEKEITNERMRKHMENYRKNGGGIGYAFVGDIEQVQSELNKALRMASGNKNMADIAYDNQVIKAIEKLNAVGENALRFSAYVADIESGRSMLDAIKMSKEITVNFNRKGEQSAGIGRIFLFANSNVQGINNLLVQPFKKNPKVAAATFGSFVATGFMLGMIEALLNSGDDEDDKDDLFEENSRMMTLKMGDVQIKLDNAYGVGWFVYLGRMMFKTAHRPETAGRNALNVASAFFDHFSFVGNPIPNEDDISAKRAIGGTAPTLLAPLMYPLLNTSRFGNDLFPDYDNGSAPDAYRSWKGTKNSRYAAIAKFMNEATGGNVVESGLIDVSPETLKMATKYAFGGVGTFFENGASSFVDAFDGEVNSQNLPIVNRFYDPLDVQNYQRRFYNEAGKARDFKDKVKKLYKAGLIERADKLRAENEDLYSAGVEAQSVWKQVNSLRDEETYINQDEELTKAEKKEKLELNSKDRIDLMKEYHNNYIMKKKQE